MRQPASRGSPRPRGYIHQPICSFISFQKRVLTKIHGSFMASFIFPQGSTPRDTCDSITLFRPLKTSLLIIDPFSTRWSNFRYPKRWLSWNIYLILGQVDIKFITLLTLQGLPLLLKYTLGTFYIILDISLYTAINVPRCFKKWFLMRYNLFHVRQ